MGTHTGVIVNSGAASDVTRFVCDRLVWSNNCQRAFGLHMRPRTEFSHRFVPNPQTSAHPRHFASSFRFRFRLTIIIVAVGGFYPRCIAGTNLLQQLWGREGVKDLGTSA